MEEAGDIFQHRLCKGWECVSTAPEGGKYDSKRSRACPRCHLLTHPPPGRGPGCDGGHGQALEDGSPSLPARQMAGTKDVAVIPPGTRKRQDVWLGLGEPVASPPECRGRGERQTEGQQPAPQEWWNTRRSFGWPRRVRGRRAPSWQQDTAGGPGAGVGRSHAGAECGCRQGRRRWWVPPRRGHLIPPGASSWGCSTPSPPLLMLPEATRAPGPHQAHEPASTRKGVSGVPPPHLPAGGGGGGGAALAWWFFWHKPLASRPSQALQAPLKGSACPGPGREPWKYHQGCKKNHPAGKKIIINGSVEAFTEDTTTLSAAKALGGGDGTFPSPLSLFSREPLGGCHVYHVTLGTWGMCRGSGRCFPTPVSFPLCI